MKRMVWIGCLLALTVTISRAEHDFGAGINYWKVVDDIDVRDVDDSGFSYFVNYRRSLGTLLRIEVGLERLPDRFGESAYAPQGYLVLGRSIYAAAGVGGIYTDGSFADDPFYAIKAGVALPLPFWLKLDLAAQYRFNDFADLKDEDRKIGTDTVFLGAALRLVL